MNCSKWDNSKLVEAFPIVSDHLNKQCVCFDKDCSKWKTSFKTEHVYLNLELGQPLRQILDFPIQEWNYLPNVKLFFTHEKVKDKRNSKGESRLHKECRDGKFQDIVALLSNGTDVNAQDFAKWTPLHEAVIAERLDVVKLLLDSGSLVNVPGSNYRTAVHIATQQKNIPIVELLIEYGGSVFSCDCNGKTPIDLCSPNDLEMLNTLCLTTTNLNLYVFTIPSLVAVYIDIKSQDMERLAVYTDITILSVNSFLNNKLVNYAVIGSIQPNMLCLRLAMLQGAFIFNVEGFCKYIESSTKNPFSYLINLPKLAILKAVMNKLNKKPPLFDSLNFYFDNSHAKISNCAYSVEDFKQLVTAGGGVILSRKPSFHDIFKESYYPYHAEKHSSIACTTTYFICDKSKIASNSINSNTVKCKSFNWIIDCIDNFCLK